jgi:hypothetical protein
MLPDKPPSGNCPRGDEVLKCELQCKYNHFESDDLVIDSWELKCLDCGYRETIAFRSDEPDSLEGCDDPTQCVYCGIRPLKTGKNVCSE